jgi:threonine synthase
VEPGAETQALLDAPQRVVEMPNDELPLRGYVAEHALHRRHAAPSV